MKKYIKSAVMDLTDEPKDSRILIAINSVRPEQLEKLSRDSETDVRIAVAENPNTSVSTLVYLSNDPVYWVRYALLKNPNTPMPLVNSIAKPSGSVSLPWDVYNYYEKLAKGEDPEILTRVSEFCDYRVRRFVAENPNTPADVLFDLASDADPGVIEAAIRNPNMPVESLVQLFHFGDEYVRYCIANGRNTPSDILDALADDESKDVRASVARNRNTSEKTLLRLSMDESNYVRNNLPRRYTK